LTPPGTSRNSLRTWAPTSRSRWVRPALPFIAGFLAILVSLAGFPSARGQAAPSEYQLKAAFLFNFAKFIDWPPGSSTGPQSPFAICVLGQDPFGRVLDDSLNGKAIGNQPLTIRRLKDKTEARHCQMVFVSSSESAHLAEILESLRGANVLVVGETSGFAAAGGTIEFTLEDNRVRFTINTDAADRAGLMFSSKRLALAKLVHDEGRSKGV
jgi:YfiR/HmsC-like